MSALPLLVLLVLGVVSTQSYRRVCYHTNWSQTMPSPGKFEPENIDPSLCTHICFAFAKLNGNYLEHSYWNDESTPWMKGMYERTIDLKKKNPSLKVLISVGGWNMGSTPFSEMVSSAASRKEFYNNSITWMRNRGFDGLDIDWEYPAGRGSPSGDKDRFSALIRETRLAFEAESKATGKSRLLLISAVPTSKYAVDSGYDIAEISKYFDFITVMTYDFHGTWETFTGHNSPLYVRNDEKGIQRTRNMEWAANYWMQQGAPADKLNIGLAFFGHGFTLADKAKSQPGDAIIGPSNRGPITGDKGVQAYYEICKMVQNGGNVSWIKDQEVPYVVKGDQWIGYDDPNSLEIKVNWIKSKGFGGITAWALPLDDFNGQCGGETYPLMKSIVRALGGVIIPGSSVPDTSVKTTQQSITGSPKKDSELCRGKADGSYGYPKSCTKYVICINGKSFVGECNPGFWNKARNNCDFDPNFKCSQGGHTVTHPSTLVTPSTGDKNLHFCRGKADGKYADPKDCTQYYECSSGLTFHERCGPNTGFDPKINSCNFKLVIPNCK